MKIWSSLIRRIKNIIMIAYGVLLIIAVAVFFLNYNGKWMKKVADKFNISEMQTELK